MGYFGTVRCLEENLGPQHINFDYKTASDIAKYPFRSHINFYWEMMLKKNQPSSATRHSSQWSQTLWPALPERCPVVMGAQSCVSVKLWLFSPDAHTMRGSPCPTLSSWPGSRNVVAQRPRAKPNMTDRRKCQRNDSWWCSAILVGQCPARWSSGGFLRSWWGQI